MQNPEGVKLKKDQVLPMPKYDSTVEITESYNQYRVTMISEISDINFCWVELYLPPEFYFKSITLNCHDNTACFVTSDTTLKAERKV